MVKRDLFSGRGQAKRVDTKSLSWWRECRFGLFIHWGLYAIPAGVWNGEEVPGIGEWIMYRRRIPVAEYGKLTGQFNPTGFNAAEWVQLAKEAGMRYLVITAKHHDGFALFRSPSNPYNIADATPWGRDPIQELAAACGQAGIPLCFYYSQDQDWHDPDGSRNDWDFDEEKKDFGRYIREKVKPQLTELLTQYGPIGLIWFDTPYTISKRYSRELKRYVKKIQPKCLVSGRIGHDLGDYGSLLDNQIPVGRIRGDYETPATMNDTWGFKKNDHNWKSVDTLLYLLVDLASKGVNYLLNVGPTAEGFIPQESKTRLQDIGRWMRLNGQAIYGTQASPFAYEFDWGRVTQRAGRLYLFFFDWPRDPFHLYGLKSTAIQAFPLADQGRRLQMRQMYREDLDQHILELSGFGAKPGDRISVVALDIDGQARIDPLPQQQADGSVWLPSFLARLHRPLLGPRMSLSPSGFTRGWTTRSNRISWSFKLFRPGDYQIRVFSAKSTQTSGPTHKIRLQTTGQTLDDSIREDEEVTNPRSRYFPETITNLGGVHFDQAGIESLSVRALEFSRDIEQGIALSGIRLVPQ